MKNKAPIFRLFGGGFRFVRKIISNILNYLTSNDLETLNDRNLLRKLYNAGYIDEIKYQDYCKQSAKGDFDPEELQLPM